MPKRLLKSRFIPNRSGRRFAAFYGVFSFAWLISGLMGDHSLLERLVFFLAALSAGVLAVRAWYSGIDVVEDGITSFTDLRTRRVRWDEIRSFEQRSWRGVGARLATGKWVTLQRYPRFSAEPKQVLTILQTALKQRRKAQ